MKTVNEQNVVEVLKDILARLDRIDAKLDKAIEGGGANV